ncbi:Ig-like domain-containing protein [Pseudoalteromonas ulvae]|uniref:VWFA domain-containing protein n=1 Tax=Pseudoalteromonas ulvae TaxID=107327 RepID=A0A244CUZ6_PSEDV|nr:Ig-like domain-containing protein [Pseudoalteromonas ulvae]OUL59374.1 hypothetical protein B1199_03645 [Pseudoalteromonas ulvae]
MYFLRLLLLTTFFVLIAGCGSPPKEESATPSPDAIIISSPTQVISVGDVAVQLVLTANFGGGAAQDVTSQATWSSSDQQIATVSDAGQLTPLKVGTVIVSAVFQDKTASYSFTIQSGPKPEEELVSIGINTASKTFLVGQQNIRLSIFGFYKDDSFRILEGPINWGSSNQSVATINSSGDMTFLSEGEVEINAVYLDFSASVLLSVQPGIQSVSILSSQQSYFAEGDYVQLTFAASFTNGTTDKLLEGVQWVSSDATRATVTQNGLLNPLTVGDVTITATALDKTAQLQIYIDEIESNRVESVNAFAIAPSKIVSIFKVFDGQDKPIEGLAEGNDDSWKNNFLIEENGVNVGLRSESFATVTPIKDVELTQPIVFALDISASISDSDFLELIQTIRGMIYTDNAQTGELVSKLLPSQTVSLVIFDQNADVYIAATKSLALIKQRLDELALLNRQSRSDNNSTDLYGGTIKGLELWRDESSSTGIVQGFMVLITDGNHESGSATLQDVIDQRGNKEVVAIYTGQVSDASPVPAELTKIATTGQVITTKGDLSLIEEAIKLQNQRLNTQIGSIYQLEYVTPKRSGEWELKISYLDGTENVPYIIGKYDASPFTQTTPAEIKLSGSSAKGTVRKGFLNVPLGESVSLEATTSWTAKLPSYSWNLQSSALPTITPPFSQVQPSNTRMILTAEVLGSDTLVIKDANNVVAGSSPIENVSYELVLNSTNIEVFSPNYKLNDNGVTSLIAQSSVSPNLFNWQVVNQSEGAICRIAKTQDDTVSESVFDASQIVLKVFSSVQTDCVVRVSDIFNQGDTFEQFIAINSEGTTIEMAEYNPSSEKLIDFENGELSASMSGSWTVIEQEYSELQGRFIVQSAADLDKGQSSVLTMVLREAVSIEFDYQLSKGAGDEFGFFINKQYQSSPLYNDQEENQTQFTRFQYTFKSTDRASENEPFVLEWAFIRANTDAQHQNVIKIDNILIKK